MSLTPLFGPIGPEVLIILLLIVLLFGHDKLPDISRSIGLSAREFIDGTKGKYRESDPRSFVSSNDSSGGSADSDAIHVESSEAISEQTVSDSETAGDVSNDASDSDVETIASDKRESHSVETQTDAEETEVQTVNSGDDGSDEDGSTTQSITADIYQHLR